MVVALECPIFQRIGTGVLDTGLLDRPIEIGETGSGHDWKWWGDTASNYMLWDQSADQLVLSGTSVTFASGSQASTAGSGTALSASRTAAFSVFSDDGNAAISSAVLTRAGRFRNLQVYTAGNREQEAAGLIGQLVSVAGTNRHNMCGLMGSYEGSGALTVDGQAWATDPWIQAGVIGRVGVGSGVATVNANGVLAGLAAMSNTASFLAQNGIYAGLYVGSWSGATDFQYGVYIQGGAVSRAFQAGEQASTAGSGVTLNATYSAAMQVFSDDGNAAIASSVLTRAGRFRNLQVYTAGNREQEATGVIGQLVSVAGTNRHNMCGVMGSYEGSGALTIDGQAPSTDPWVQAGVIGRVGVGSGTTTLNSNGRLAGLAAMSNTASMTNNGVYTGLYVGRWGSNMDWGYGIYLENVDVGIQFAHTLTPDSTRTNRAIGIGSRATEMDVTMGSGADQHLDPMQLNLNIIGSNPSNSSTLNASYKKITHDTTAMTNLRLKCTDWNILVGVNVKDVYCIQGEVDFTATSTIGGEAACLGLTMDCQAGTISGNVWNTILVTQGTSLPAATSAALFLSHRSGTLAHSLYIEANSGATITDAIYINPAGTLTNFINFSGTGGSVVSTSSGGGTRSFKITCKVGATTAYMSLYTD